jgi:hypothetical protein
MGIFRILFPLPKQTYNSDRTSDANQCIAMFTTSLSTVRTNLMTLPGCMGKVEEDSDVCVGVVAWLKIKDFFLFVGENVLEVGADKQPAI